MKKWYVDDVFVRNGKVTTGVITSARTGLWNGRNPSRTEKRMSFPSLNVTIRRGG